MRISSALLFGACLLFPAASTIGAQVNFETVPVGTQYGGSAGNVPGQVVLTQDSIAMSVEQFQLNTFTAFFRAEVGGTFDSQFPTTPLSMNNINAEFDFTNVGFNVNQVTIDYYYDGGGNNFSVNGQPIIELNSDFSSLSPNIAPGVTAIADEDSITLTGSIQSVLIGGQELGIDNIVAIPEPTSLLLLSGAALMCARRRNRSAKS